MPETCPKREFPSLFPQFPFQYYETTKWNLYSPSSMCAIFVDFDFGRILWSGLKIDTHWLLVCVLCPNASETWGTREIAYTQLIQLKMTKKITVAKKKVPNKIQPMSRRFRHTPKLREFFCPQIECWVTSVSVFLINKWCEFVALCLMNIECGIRIHPRMFYGKLKII